MLFLCKTPKSFTRSNALHKASSVQKDIRIQRRLSVREAWCVRARVLILKLTYAVAMRAEAMYACIIMYAL
eukprot:6208797-Pleurochrysis_carterae.AAC.1